MSVTRGPVKRRNPDGSQSIGHETSRDGVHWEFTEETRWTVLPRRWFWLGASIGLAVFSGVAWLLLRGG